MGQSLTVGDYRLGFQGVELVRKPHLTAHQATLEVDKRGRSLGAMTPALNYYPTQREPISTPSVRSSLSHDLYLTVMSVDEQGRIGLRAIVTPAVAWIWIGVFVMVAGTALCLLPPRPVTVAEAGQELEAATP